MITVVLVDDQQLVRAGLRALLERDPEISVAGEAVDGRDGLAVVRRLRPDVVLMDLRMPRMNGADATAAIRADPDLVGVHVLILTTFDSDAEVLDAVRAGAAGYVLKDIDSADLRRAVRVIADGGSLLSPSVARTVLQEVAARPAADPHPGLAELTEREREVLARVGHGDSNDEIAAELFISPATARTYVSRLLTKLGARDRTQLAVIAYRSGLV
jgi:DNA-binding NarL/FixJ family response regulator